MRAITGDYKEKNDKYKNNKCGYMTVSRNVLQGIMRFFTDIFLILFLLIFSCLLLPAASAESTIVDASTGMELTSAIITASTGTLSVEYLVTPGNRVSFPLSMDETRLSIKDNFSDSIRYYAFVAANTSPRTIIAHPAGTLLLQVKDDRDNFVSRGAVTITCPALQTETVTDRAGLLRIVLPTGECIVSVTAHDRVSSGAYVINQGDVTLAVIVLNGTVVSGQPDATGTLSDNLILMFAVLGIALALVLLVFHRGRLKLRKAMSVGKQSVEAAVGDDATAGATAVARVIKASLTAKEKVIVDQLIACGGCMTLSMLRSNTRIPRTSLLRTLEGLEHRSVVVKKSEHGKVMISLVP